MVLYMDICFKWMNNYNMYLKGLTYCVWNVVLMNIMPHLHISMDLTQLHIHIRIHVRIKYKGGF